MTEPRYFIAQAIDEDDGWSIAVGTTACAALGETCARMDADAECEFDDDDDESDVNDEHPGAPYRVQLSEVESVKLSSLVDLRDNEDGVPPIVWDVLETEAMGGGATDYFPAGELTDEQSGELETLLQLCSLEDRRAALDVFAAKAWPFGWWNVKRDERGKRRTVAMQLLADVDTWDDALPEWAKT